MGNGFGGFLFFNFSNDIFVLKTLFVSSGDYFLSGVVSSAGLTQGSRAESLMD